MKVSKTASFHWLIMILGVLKVTGVADLPLDQIEQLLGNISHDSLALWMIVSGPIGLLLRKVTNGPVAKGFMGLLGKKE